VVARKDVGEGCQLFPPKHLQKTAVGIVFLETKVDFHHSICAGYKHSKSHSMKHASSNSKIGLRKGGDHASCCSSHLQKAFQHS
jgi:hypothetical protein